MTELFKLAAGVVAGFIDAIAGGGGLITVPSLALAMHTSGPLVIGTNKVVGTLAALVAFIVYARRGFFVARSSVVFTVCIGMGSYVGSRASVFVPAWGFRALMLVTLPLVWWVVSQRNLWVERTGVREAPGHAGLLVISGLSVGFYDGLWGPGGGTFMFLSLVFLAGLPLGVALAASKLANTVSAASALMGYASQRLVDWSSGAVMGTGVCAGAFIGALITARSLALGSDRAERLVRGALGLVAGALTARVVFFG